MGMRVILAGGFGGLILLLSSTYAASAGPRNQSGILIGGFAFGIIAAGVIWYITRFDRFCNYVGENGVARYRLSGNTPNPAGATVFPFPSASELRSRQTRNFINGIYSQTTYAFAWSDPQGKIVFKISGDYRDKEGRPKPRDGFWFARAAEASWNNYQLGWVAEQVKTMGFAQFNLTGGNFVRVGPGFFEFGMKGEVARIGVDEIKSLNLSEGQFHITHKDARWFSRKGKFNFSYASMANAQLFLLAMEKLTGYQFE
jgi:hypothetical protein